MIESVPNISEGRRPDVIAELTAAADATPGVVLLDASADPSHNRSVFTMAGGAEALSAVLLRLFGIAIARIDLREHRGVHPRIGAVDVVPFIPMEGSTMDECVALSRSLGQMVAETFGVPIYLYEESATDPRRRRLEDVRRGQFELLEGRMRKPGWAPDFGPHVPHLTAGATAIGARKPLIAYNINLDSPDVNVAKQIAAAVRERGGGLPCVKALGLALPHRGVAQVSMNLTDFSRTPVQTVFDAVELEAEARGVHVLESELIGLIPAAALERTSPERLKLSGFSSSRILEERLEERLSQQHTKG